MEKHCRVLVTGCAGFIGRHVVDRLVADGMRVTGVDDFSTSDRDTFAGYRERIDFIEGSLVEVPVAERAVDGVERVIHLASVPSVPRSVANPPESAYASIIGTVNLLNAARQSGVVRVVQASSSSVYGESEVIPRIETLPPAPMSPYAVAKLTQEYYAKAFYSCYGLDSASLRYFNVFGPRQNPNSKYAAVIPKFITGMMAGERPVVFGDGEQTRDFTYVANVVDANIMAVFSPEPLRGEFFNIGNGGATSLNQLIAQLNEILGTSLEPEYQPARVGDVRDSKADIDKAAAAFGYNPSISFRDGLAKTIASFRG